ncbi:type III endosome membrane protein TEMP isoform X1 [Alexandromys fortis]|uniref:type III endosome membrane protein TEMP isoform X1 n=1 Tax=Alexandromys fortis TaxID=100897 RepID=UPI0021526472|nr:type III endosome membrane protein TEMP isoform X1 [Microtus fortis]XP_050017182.1 type III endosome membrane protein TEMP isoform X1 [Microtus fortis]
MAATLLDEVFLEDGFVSTVSGRNVSRLPGPSAAWQPEIEVDFFQGETNGVAPGKHLSGGDGYPVMDGDRDRDLHWSTGLSTQGPVEEQKEGEDEQGSQDREGFVHPLRRCDWYKGSSPNPAGLGLNEHVIKPDSLNVADNEG